MSLKQKTTAPADLHEKTKPVSVKHIFTAPFDLYELSNVRAYLMGLATLLVTFYHSQYLDLFSSELLTKTRLLPVVTRIHKTGNSGVDLFVLLSGFGLFFAYSRLLEKEPAPLRSFYRRRFGKILPSILLVTVLTYGFLGADDARDWQGKVFLYAAYLPGRGGGNFWYFSYLMGLYLIYPLVHRVIRGKHGTPGAAGLIALSVAAALSLRALAPSYYYGRADLMLTRFPAFVLGAWLGKMSREHRKIPTAVPMAAVPGSVLLLVLVADSPDSFYDYRFYAYCFLVLGIALSHAWIFSMMKKRGVLYGAVAFLGSFSMEIYLIYETIYYHGRSLFTVSEPTGLVYAVTVFTVTLILSVLLRTAVEKLKDVYAAARGV